MKINIDGACAMNKSGIGVLVQDDRAEIVAAMVDVLPKMSL